MGEAKPGVVPTLFVLAVGLCVSALAILPGCQRDGFACSSDADCYTNEACERGTCVTELACEPQSDEQLCASSDVNCGEPATIEDSCGTDRDVVCPCPNNACEPADDSALCAQASLACGASMLEDSCGQMRSVDCGACTEGGECVENQCTGCAPPMCSPDACGIIANSCGEEVTCDAVCDSGQSCIDNECRDPFLAPDDLQPGDRFGEEVRLDGELLFVGAPGAAANGVDGAGAIYVFRVDEMNLMQVQRIVAPEPSTDEAFGAAFDVFQGRLVAVAGRRLLTFDAPSNAPFSFVGEEALANDVQDINIYATDSFLISFSSTTADSLYAGSCSMEGCSVGLSWTDQPTEHIGLGFAIESDGGNVIVGAPFDTIDPANDLPEGSFYILSDQNVGGSWDTTSWIGGPTYHSYREYTGIVGREPTIGLGRSVAISDDGRAVVGAPYDESLFVEGGGIALYSREWERGQRFDGLDRLEGSRCGHSVALTRSLGFASCVNDAPRGTMISRAVTEGTVSVYRFDDATTEWELTSAPIELPNGAAFDHFGWTLEASDDTLFVGAPGRNNDTGEVWFYTFE